ncbi:MAG: DarT ssDNA thymidine ADP-ribosyltransferase family protein [Neisseria sp.]|nr:DarT ssDNA thymidine ADP-ribosyltransferase family protein [Neisseria sp.]
MEFLITIGIIIAIVYFLETIGLLRSTTPSSKSNNKESQIKRNNLTPTSSQSNLKQPTANSQQNTGNISHPKSTHSLVQNKENSDEIGLSGSGIRRLFTNQHFNNIPIPFREELSEYAHSFPSPTLPPTQTTNSIPLTPEQIAIQHFVQQQNIPYLVHFTRKENLSNILEHGLLDRNSLTQKEVGYYFNDQFRVDKIQDGICCSISFPNYKMFWHIKKTQESQYGVNPDNDWVILRLSPELLWRKKAYFCRYNAASNLERFNSHKTDLNALKAMFEDLEVIKRSDLNIPNHYPTNPQAEVVFIEPIEPEWIMDVCNKNGYGMNCYLRNNINQPYQYESDTLFKPRSDYQHWIKH